MPKPISNPTARQGLQIGDRLMVQCEDQLFYKALVTRVNDESVKVLFDIDDQTAEISHQAAADPIRGICALDKRQPLLTGVSGEEADAFLQTELPIGGPSQGRQRRRRRTREEMEADGASKASVEHVRPSGITDDMAGRTKGYRNKLAALPTLTHDAMMGVFNKATVGDLTETQSPVYDEFHEMRLLEEAFPDKLPSLHAADYDACRQEQVEALPDADGRIRTTIRPGRSAEDLARHEEAVEAAKAKAETA